MGGLKIPTWFDGCIPIRSARLIEQLRRLPGIGAKSAQRLAYHIPYNPREDAERLCDAMRRSEGSGITYCSVCSAITDADPCYYCTHPDRDRPYNLRR